MRNLQATLFLSTIAYVGVYVPKFKGFTIWGAVFKNETTELWVSQVVLFTRGPGK